MGLVPIVWMTGDFLDMMSAVWHKILLWTTGIDSRTQVGEYDQVKVRWI
jgi:hypothetical protein